MRPSRAWAISVVSRRLSAARCPSLLSHPVAPLAPPFAAVATCPWRLGCPSGGPPRSPTPGQRCGSTFESSASFPPPPRRRRRQRRRQGPMAAGRCGEGECGPARVSFFCFGRPLSSPHHRRRSSTPINVTRRQAVDVCLLRRGLAVLAIPRGRCTHVPRVRLSLPTGLPRRRAGLVRLHHAVHQDGGGRQPSGRPTPPAAGCIHV